MKIREIPYHSPWYEQCKALRQDVLRTPIGLVLTDKDVTGEDQQLHIAAIDNKEVVGVIILKPLSDHTIKFRQVAVADRLQGKGVGRQLMAFAEAVATSKRFKHIEMNARITAQVFYEKLGYKATGETFIEVGLETIKMIKSVA